MEILGQDFINNNQRYQFMVVDPFKMDYCPSKIKVDQDEASLYISKFKSAFESLDQGKLPI